MEADFCIEALKEAMARFGKPLIFNTDQGSQFTSPRFTEVLAAAKVKISMYGRGRWMENHAPRNSCGILRTAVALAQIRMRLPQRLRDRIRSPRRDREVGGL